MSCAALELLCAVCDGKGWMQRRVAELCCTVNSRADAAGACVSCAA
jgi:hypothetical protein